MEYSELRESKVITISAQGYSENLMNKNYHLYYDETNNIKKLRLNTNTNDFNNDPLKFFVLGGIEGEETINSQELFRMFELQSNANEVKSKTVIKGNTLFEALKNKKITSFLDYILNNNWHIHFCSMNMLYWALVDIIDSVNIPKSMLYYVFNIKSLLYKVGKCFIEDIKKIFINYDYPNLRDKESINKFYEDLLCLCEKYDNYSNQDELNTMQLLKCVLDIGSKQEEVIFIQDETAGLYLDKLRTFYDEEIYTWINSSLVFDNEEDIIESLESNPVELGKKKLSNYKFVDSKTEPCIQMSDVIVKLIERYLKDIDNEGLELENKMKKDELVYKNFIKLNKIMLKSQNYNPLFIHDIIPIHIHAILEYYMQEHGRE